MTHLTWTLLLATMARAQHCSRSENCEDQTALLQSHLASHKSSQLQTASDALLFPDVSRLTDPANRKLALVQFHDTALALAESGSDIPDTVAETCQIVIDMLQEAVMDGINASHKVEKTAVAEAYAAFQHVEDTFATHSLAVHTRKAEMETVGNHSVACDIHQEQVCEQCQICKLSCIEQERDCDEAFKNMTESFGSVVEYTSIGASCDDSHNLVVPSPAYEQQTIWDEEPFWSYVDGAWADHVAKRAIYYACLAAELPCENDRCGEKVDCVPGQHPGNNHLHFEQDCICQNYTIQSSDCLSQRENRADLQCAYLQERTSHQITYNVLYSSVEANYELTCEGIELRVSDRKVEFDTLTRAICLLGTLIYNDTHPDPVDGWVSRNGTDGDYKDRIDSCEHMEIDASWLDIAIPDVPDRQVLPLFDSPCSQSFTSTLHTSQCGLDTVTSTLPPTEADCTCETLAERNHDEEFQHFPVHYGPFFLYHVPFQLNTAEPVGDHSGFLISGDSWEITTNESIKYSGPLSGSEGLELFAYPDPTLPELPDSMLGKDFIRYGGLISRDANGLVTAVQRFHRVEFEFTAAVSQSFKRVFTAGQTVAFTQQCTAFQPSQAPYNAIASEWCWNPNASQFQVQFKMDAAGNKNGIDGNTDLQWTGGEVIGFSLEV